MELPTERGIVVDRSNHCVKAINAGLDERMTRVAERTGALLTTMLPTVMDDRDLAMTDAQRAALPGAIRSALALVPGSWGHG